MSIISMLLGEKKKIGFGGQRAPANHPRARTRGRRFGQPDYLPALQRELMAVISKYVSINPEDIKVQLERQDNLEVLEVKIELPESSR